MPLVLDELHVRLHCKTSNSRQSRTRNYCIAWCMHPPGHNRCNSIASTPYLCSTQYLCSSNRNNHAQHSCHAFAQSWRRVMLGDGASILRMTFHPSILGEASRGNAAPAQASGGECGSILGEASRGNAAPAQASGGECGSILGEASRGNAAPAQPSGGDGRSILGEASRGNEAGWT